MQQDDKDLTSLLAAVNAGQAGAMHRLLALVYDELRSAADRLLRGRVRPGRPGGSLQPTVLVHEGFLKLLAEIKNGLRVERRGHFFTAYATCMREFLLDYVRRRKALKRGGGWVRVPLEPGRRATARDAGLWEFQDALEKLEKLDSRKGKLVELRLLCGLTNAEVAQALNVSLGTVERDWAFARAWLRKELCGEQS